jgi:hypothetical protein
MGKPIRIKSMKPTSIRIRSAKPTSIRFRDVLEMEETGTWRDTGDKYMNYYRGILPFLGSLGSELCSAMAFEWEKKSID